MADKELFDQYEHALRTIATLAHDKTSDLVSRIDYDVMTPEQCAAALLAEYPEIVRTYGIAAADIAREYYQQERELAMLEDEYGSYDALPANPGAYEWAVEDVRKSAAAGVDMLPGEALRRIYQRADRTIAENARRDPAHPMWAIIPHPGACGWCLMVAANGWSYSSQRAANAQRHSNCRCSVAIDFNRDHPSLEGYDPDAYYDVYDQALQALGGDDGIFAQWDALSPDEQAKYRRSGRGVYDVFKMKVVTAKMDEITGHTH
ncbi:MAG: hypothetical protein IKG21_13150 [Atopobiaceae bacterium]|nr:hypothetical protein [Atopobiaceae bacterium]